MIVKQETRPFNKPLMKANLQRGLTVTSGCKYSAVANMRRHKRLTSRINAKRGRRRAEEMWTHLAEFSVWGFVGGLTAFHQHIPPLYIFPCSKLDPDSAPPSLEASHKKSSDGSQSEALMSRRTFFVVSSPLMFLKVS